MRIKINKLLQIINWYNSLNLSPEVVSTRQIYRREAAEIQKKVLFIKVMQKLEIKMQTILFEIKAIEVVWEANTKILMGHID